MRYVNKLPPSGVGLTALPQASVWPHAMSRPSAYRSTPTPPWIHGSQGEYDEEASMKAWEAMMDRYADRWNVMSLDLRCALQLASSVHIHMDVLTCVLCVPSVYVMRQPRPIIAVSDLGTPTPLPPPTPQNSNEPHGLASWGESNPLTDYNHYYERLINRLKAKYPDWKVRGFA